MARRSNESRKTLGYTQKDVARMVGVSERTVRYYEAGQSSNLKLAQFYKSMDQKVHRLTEKAMRSITSSYISGSRREAGVTLRDIAIKTGLSKSTISRYESGQSVSAQSKKVLDNYYRTFESNVKYLDRIQSAERQVNIRKKELERAGYKNAPALMQLRSRGGLKSSAELGVMTNQQIKRYIRYLEDFFSKQTSSVAGAEMWNLNVTIASMNTSQINDVIANEVYWKLYNRLMSDKDIAHYWSEQGFDSDQAQEDITAVFFDVISTPHMVDPDSSTDIEEQYLKIKQELEQRGLI